MMGRRVRPLVAVTSVLILAAAGIALQPERGGGGGDGQPQGQPAGGQPGGERGGQPAGGGRGQASVEGGMRGMNRALRQLSAQIGDATKKDENLRLINEMQRGCVTAKGAALTEKFLEGKDDAAKKKLAVEFRSELIKLLRLMLDIETDLAEGKTDAAKAKMAELEKLRDHGHEEMGMKAE
jgi:hypothetical protein